MSLFQSWARQARKPMCLRPTSPADSGPLEVARLIGNARIVLLGEAVHFAAEPLEFRNRLFRHLVQQEGFTAIALECGLLEARLMDQYVAGELADLDPVLTQGLSWTFGSLWHNQALLEWIRQFNRAASRRVTVYGFDIPGSPGNSAAACGLSTAPDVAMKAVAQVEPCEAAALEARLGRFRSRLRFSFEESAGEPGYHELDQVERDQLSAIVADIVSLLGRRERLYLEAMPNEYSWVLRAAICARQADDWLRRTRPGRPSLTAQREHLLAISDVRDRAQADNLEWILEREGASGKLLAFAHNGHLSRAPLEIRWRGSATSGTARPPVYCEPAGSYLSRRFGSALVAIGNVIGRNRLEDGAVVEPPPDSIEELAKHVDATPYVLDLRSAPDAVRQWLKAPRALGDLQGRGQNLHAVNFASAVDAFDVLLYIDEVRAAPRRTLSV